MFTGRPSFPSVPKGTPSSRASMVQATKDSSSKDSSSFRFLPFWPGNPKSATEDAAFYHSWLDCLRNASDGTVLLHPDIAVPTPAADDPPLIYTYQAEQEQVSPGSFSSLAVLAARTRQIRPLPCLPWRASLRERYLLADQVLGDCSIEAMSPFVEAVCQVLRSGEADQVFFEDVEVGSPLWRLLAELNGARGIAVYYPFQPQARWRLRFPEKPEGLWDTFSTKCRDNFRKRLKKFSHQLRCYREPADVGEFLAKAREVSRKSWQTQHRGLRITGDGEQQRWMERIASLGAMRCYILEHEGSPAAFMQSVQWNGTFLGLETGYDRAFARFSPGTVLLLRMLEDLIARQTPRLLDFGWGDAGYKRLFSNEQKLSGRVLLVRRAIKPLLFARLRHIGQAIKTLARSVLRRSETLTRIVRKYRRSGII